MGRHLDHDGRTDPTERHIALFAIFVAALVGAIAIRNEVPRAVAFVFIVASFMAVVWQVIYLCATFDAGVRKVRPFPTQPVRAPKGTVTTDWVGGGAEYIGRLAAAGVLDDAERIFDELDRIESHPHDWANEEET